MSKLCTIVAIVLMVTITGCAAMKITRASLDDTVRDYQQLIRWQEVPSAAVFVSDQMKPAYLEQATGFNRVKIVDYRIKAVDFSKELKKATVIVEYDYHLKSGLTINTIVDTQTWQYFEKTEPEGWRLTSYPPAFP
ncbi:hypothetical protein [Geobacter sp. OR-1]|uniref:hypothetical protein n=1 Tax=Geobacter sp. OR-1 TaxID=1266765 RepID=UPI0005AB2BA3|nr:hypothetical protein [Geobacter sp. OR-1]